jgi:deoxyribose-phosphate aldolase
MEPSEIATMIDHTILKPSATGAAIDKFCDEAVEYNFVAVCVNPVWVSRCRARLAGTAVKIASVVCFPLGASRTDMKVTESKRAIDDGASEIDMVVQLGELMAGNTAFVRDDIAAVAEAVHAADPGYKLKVILEAAALTPEQIVAGCRCAVEARADFVKTSTGFHAAGGAKVDHIRLMRRHAGSLGIKAAGGIRTLASMKTMIEAGATRIGCSAGPKIMNLISRLTF